MINRFLKWFWKPSAYAWGGIFVVGGVAGILFWGGFHTAMEETNTLDFCISCHEMEENVYQEYKETIHFTNRTGVRATCSDCHVPDPWFHKVVRKVQATNELISKALGSIDTPEKFENRRLTLAKNVWKAMKETDSRECRNCHSWDAMSSDLQKLRARKKHQEAREENMTCIDCHKGIAHRPVHELLDPEVDDFYDGKADPRRLISKVEEAKLKAEAAKAAEEAAKAAKAAEEAAAKAAEVAATATETAAATSSGSGANWDGVAEQNITLFYPGQTSWEWLFKGSEHGGARALKKLNDRCIECHLNEEAEMGAKIVGGDKAEETPIPGKRASIAVTMKASHDGENLHLRFQWPDTGHTAAPFVEGGKMDPDNQIKLAFMLDDGKVEEAGYAGCWATCHHDSRYMPDQPDAAAIAGSGDAAQILHASNGVTKYLTSSRSEINIKGRNDSRRGGWDKLLDAGEIDSKRTDGAYMDLVRYKSGDNKIESGSILDQRLLEETDKLTANGTLADGVWTVEITRPLKATQPGGVDLEPGKLYTIGIAIHDDYTSARFHHVSLEYKLGLDNPEAEINAIKK